MVRHLMYGFLFWFFSDHVYFDNSESFMQSLLLNALNDKKPRWIASKNQEIKTEVQPTSVTV